MSMKKTNRKVYSESEKISALAIFIESGTLSAASEKTGIPISTIGRWYKDPAYADKIAELTHIRDDLSGNVREYMEKRQARVFSILDKILDNLYNDEKLASATYSQLTTAFGTLIDKYTASTISRVRGADEDTGESGVIVLPEIGDFGSSARSRATDEVDGEQSKAACTDLQPGTARDEPICPAASASPLANAERTSSANAVNSSPREICPTACDIWGASAPHTQETTRDNVTRYTSARIARSFGAARPARARGIGTAHEVGQ